MKVIVYAICKNEEKFVEGWVASMAEADGIYVLDTGSTDDTVAKLRALGVRVTVEEIAPWRFDTARNRSLDLVPEDADICVCTDLDEVFRPGWREQVETAWQRNGRRLHYRYTWNFLPDGREGYTKESYLGTWYAGHSFSETEFRQRVCDTALTYLGAHYRWGGKSPLGIDCSGLAFMSYWLNGVAIYRDAHIRPDFPVHEIPRSEMKQGDLLFFPGHVAIYLGDGRYVHSTGKSGSDGVVLNSLNPADPDYREDLDKGMTAVGSIF